ncbi:MAG: radical SAM protein [Clostridia bacterium]|nr:radical SAM protein [Clostridia bacterium]MDY3785796.1 radical SAM protein [Eubacteriales bacterium]
MKETPKTTATIMSINRHRITTDGDGITTLVTFYGCPLRCKYCLNPVCFAPDTPRTDLTPDELYRMVVIDDLYFIASGGGVTFGGGEPLLNADFLKGFYNTVRTNGKQWRLCAETSLAVPWENVRTAAGIFDMFFVDCKDSNPEIYRKYTGKSNSLMLENLAGLVNEMRAAGKDPAEHIVIRIPLIADFNTDGDRQKSAERFATLGLKKFDFFTYIIR